MTDTGEVIEFCDPRIQTIKSTIEEIFDIEITNHALYFYGVKKVPKSDSDI
jgi:Fur family ferric uptake transcriptional regulator